MIQNIFIWNVYGILSVYFADTIDDLKYIADIINAVFVVCHDDYRVPICDDYGRLHMDIKKCVWENTGNSDVFEMGSGFDTMRGRP